MNVLEHLGHIIEMGLIPNSIFALGVINGIKPIETGTKAVYFSITVPTLALVLHNIVKKEIDFTYVRRPGISAGSTALAASILGNGAIFCLGTLMGKSITRASKDLL